ncbi:hsp90 co-chaperone Cdc37-like 1 isoform X2 [Latimeria chalumnae]|uniref:hsp90 co-chaperone Cdc37-like 1 isoform X2 n=1 Tax=Latimeria chalumnae TaxID=7897 RepID=UPI0003C10DA8|nr:PREDICTED: hsp90 co-chaperone Cdc37-like 1 isoform X2 [Latimeria chalumnae]|eukprot:XP_005998939.1 PREDICTED: hsp90 co-chaperone Cdc37-like 1 isoform X2 [Latimeria chalumnae]
MEYAELSGAAFSDEEEGSEAMGCQPAVFLEQMCIDGMDAVCHNQKEFVKNRVACKWNIAEAQQKLCCLELHNSESVEQEHAKAQTGHSELKQKEEEWRQKEEDLEREGRMSPSNADAIISVVFNKKEALMEQVAHQAVVMQFILQLAKSYKMDPRGCFRSFFQKAKTGEEGFAEAFKTELEAFLWRVRVSSKNRHTEAMNVCEGRHPNPLVPGGLDPSEFLESLPLELKKGFQLQDRQIIQNVLSGVNPQVAEYYVQHGLGAGLWNWSTKGPKEETREEPKMMDTF